MAITYPIIYTYTYDEEVSYPEAVAEETVRKLAQDANLISKLAPIGSIRAFALNQPGVQAPDSNLWQICDGSEITNPTSPLRSIGFIHNFTPSLVDTLIRGAASVGANNNGGTPVIALSHNHGGQTGNFAPGFSGAGDIQVPSMHNHTHEITDDLGSQAVLNLAHQKVAFYIKINS